MASQTVSLTNEDHIVFNGNIHSHSLIKQADKYSVRMLACPRSITDHEGVEANSETGSVLKKREDFAISLRKKKHTEMVQSKRKANTQKAFERTIQLSSVAAGSTGQDIPHMEIKDTNTMLQVISYLDSSDVQPEDRLMMLRGLRIITVESTNLDLIEVMIKSNEIVPKLFGLLSQTGFLSFPEKSECLWILTNLACEQEVCYKMLQEWNVYSLITVMIESHFNLSEEHPKPLDEFELAFLEQLLWFTTNVVADQDRSQVDALGCNLDKLLAIVLQNYKAQFTESMLRVLTWCYNVMSLGLKFLSEPSYDVFNCFLCLHFEEVSNRVLTNPSVEAKDQASFKQDMMGMLSNVIRDACDEQIKFITSQPHLQKFTLEILEERNLKNIQPCLRFLGNLIATNDAKCTELVAQKHLLDLMKPVFVYCSKHMRKEALWLLSNVVANSEMDAIAFLKHPTLLTNILISCQDKAIELRKEAVWTLSNLLNSLHDQSHIELLLSMDIMSTFLEIIEHDSQVGSVCSLALSGVSQLLNKGGEPAMFAFSRQGGHETIESLQLSQFHEIFKLSQEILERHCGAKEMDQLEKMEFINSKQALFNV